MGNFILLNKKEVNKLITVKDARLLMESVIKLEKEKTILSKPPRMTLDLDSNSNDLYQFRAGYVKNIGKIGLRIANLKSNEMRHVLLIDAKNSKILALINESDTFRLRVGGTVANIIKYLSKKSDSVVGLIGAGSVARGICLAIDELGIFDNIVVFDINERIKNDFVKKMRKATRLKMTPANSIQEAVENADVVTTATTANEPLVKYEWIKGGCLIISLGMGQELEQQLVCTSDKIIVDDIELCKAVGDIAYLIKNGFLNENQIYGNLHDIFKGIKKGREADSERIIVVSQGIIAGDIALINFVYKRALKEGRGIVIKT